MSTDRSSAEPVRGVAALAPLGVAPAAPGFVQGTIGFGGAVPLDPFLSITEFWMSEPIFAPHPHAGFSAVTYMFPDSVGRFVNRDSLGDRSLIGPGSLHWTQAAGGMLHEEIPEQRGVVCHGMQLFVDLRGADKQIAPSAFHLDAADVPVVRPVLGATVRVVLGTSHGVTSPLVGLAEPIGLVDVDLGPGVPFEHTVAPDERAVVLVYRGSVTTGATTVGEHEVAVLDGPASTIAVRAGDRGAAFLALAGRPMGQPVVFRGPFVALDRAGIEELDRRYRAGGMGSLAPSS